MWLKFTRSIMILVFLSICLSLAGCVDEPTIEPVKVPFSVTRIGNFTNNVATINVSIDGKAPVSIQQNKTTEYFDITSGKRKFLVTNAATGEVLYNKEITLVSYEESSIYFGGYFSTDIAQNTFAPFYIPEGDTYISENPKSGKSFVYFADMSSDIPKTPASSDIIAAKKFQITAVLSQPGKADTTINFTKSAALEYGKQAGLEVSAGTLKITVANSENSADVLAQYDGAIDPGLRYFFYLNLTTADQNPQVVSLVPDKQSILPVRLK